MGLNFPVILHNQLPLATLMWKILLIFLNTVNRPYYLKIFFPNLDHVMFLKEFGFFVFINYAFERSWTGQRLKETVPWATIS